MIAMAANDEIMRLDMVEKSTMEAILKAPVLPDFPTEDGNYYLSITVDEGEVSMSWASESHVPEDEEDLPK